MHSEPTLPLDLKQRALETFGLEVMTGAEQDDAIVAAVMSALEALQRQVTEEISELALKFAADIDAYIDGDGDGVQKSSTAVAEELADDGAATLMWFARQLKERIPAEGDYDYVPTVGDTVEVILLGTVDSVADNAGPDATWVFDNEYITNFFAYRDPVRVRLMHRGEDGTVAR